MSTKIVEFDARPIIAANQEPFQEIMAAVESLKDDQSLLLHAPFNPVPLVQVMTKKGFANKVEQLHEKHWQVHFYKES